MSNGNVPTTVGPQDTITLNVSGVKTGAPGRGGLPMTLASESMLLSHLLDTWGDGSGISDPDVDIAALKAAVAKGQDSLEEELAKIANQLSAEEFGGALPDRVQAAVFNFLKEEKDIITAESDPGNDVWYVNPADFKYVIQKHDADGYQWFVMLAAPFG